ncbi:hypothetical protein ACIHFC_37470 [Streptomyces sp. NPDC052013]|uniref:hypothetical protein n=1 Tax=Streptomyces sp. NPDC052013 TaxID=3365679 RepID=UPI0037D13455
MDNNDNIDLPINVTFVANTGALGTLPGLTEAVFDAPKLTSPGEVKVLSSSEARNVVYGMSGAATLKRLSDVGTYSLRLDNQNMFSTPSAAIITGVGSQALGSENNRCFVSKSLKKADASEELFISCKTTTGRPVDTAFQMHFTARQ